MLRKFAATSLTLLASVSAQSVVHVPAGFDQLDALGTARPVPGTFLRARLQILVGASLLANLPGNTELTAISLRRDGSDLSALDAGSAQLIVRLSSQAPGPTAGTPAFAANHGSDLATVFQGAVSFPASPALRSRNDPDWSSQHSFTIPFAAPFRYAGGALCFDVEGTPTQPTRWPVDFHADLAAGSLLRIGAACGPVAAITTKTLRASDWSLRAGATVSLMMIGERASFGLLMLGAQPISPGLSLAFLGAPGCTLHLVPMLSISTPVTVRRGRGPTHPGIGSIDLLIPNEPHFVAAQFYAQWANFKDLRITTSDAALVQLANTVAPLDAATVASTRADGLPMPSFGSVLPGHMPVLRLEVR